MLNYYIRPTQWSPWRAGLFLGCMQALGCSNDLGTIYDQELGEPVSAVIVENETSNQMVVLSNLPNLCSHLQTATPPSGSWWLVSAWDSSPLKGAGSFAAFQDDEGLEEHSGTLQKLEVKAWRNFDDVRWHRLGRQDDMDEVKVRLDIAFDDGSNIRRTLETVRCHAPAFNGLQ